MEIEELYIRRRKLIMNQPEFIQWLQYLNQEVNKMYNVKTPIKKCLIK